MRSARQWLYRYGPRVDARQIEAAIDTLGPRTFAWCDPTRRDGTVDGDRHVADALDEVEPRPLPPPEELPTGAASSLGAAQADNPPDDPEMIAADAVPLDADVEWEGDGPVPPRVVGNEDPAPGIP